MTTTLDEIAEQNATAHPDFIPATDETCDAAKLALRVMHTIFGDIEPPEVTLDGEGNLYMEWRGGRESRFNLCLCNNKKGSYLFICDDGEALAMEIKVGL